MGIRRSIGWWVLAAAVVAGVVVLAVVRPWGATGRAVTSGRMKQEVYVWQRKWGPGVVEAVRRSSGEVSGYVVLAAEVSFSEGRVSVVKAPVDYAVLRQAGRRVGLAMRIGPYGGPYAKDDEVGRLLVGLAAALVGEAKAAGIEVSELQIDFDAATSKLRGYRVWVEAIKEKCEPIAVTITALPTWLGRAGFAELARLCPGYVLQVHSVERPTGVDEPMTLCDVEKVRRWIVQADDVGVAFRLALPTYGYVAAFDGRGKFVGLSAEGVEPGWGEGVRTRLLEADAGAMARIVKELTERRPMNLRGLIWYRLPVAEDRLNWRWATLSAVMSGRAPEARWAAWAERSGPELVDLKLINRGDGEGAATVDVVVKCVGRVAAWDGLGGWTVQRVSDDELRLRRIGEGAPRLRPGEERTIGWVRFEEDTEVQCHVEKQKR